MTFVYHFYILSFSSSDNNNNNNNAVIIGHQHPALVPLEGTSRKQHQDQEDHQEEEEELRRRGLITHLPGLDYIILAFHNIPVTYWLVLWSNGGLGCSGLIGLLREHVVRISWNDKLQLTPNPYSWNKTWPTCCTLNNPGQEKVYQSLCLGLSCLYGTNRCRRVVVDDYYSSTKLGIYIMVSHLRKSLTTSQIFGRSKRKKWQSFRHQMHYRYRMIPEQ